jgi:hypothetical protein
MKLTGAVWRKSTRSNGLGGECVEVADNLRGWSVSGTARTPLARS